MLVGCCHAHNELNFVQKKLEFHIKFYITPLAFVMATELSDSQPVSGYVTHLIHVIEVLRGWGVNYA